MKVPPDAVICIAIVRLSSFSVDIVGIGSFDVRHYGIGVPGAKQLWTELVGEDIGGSELSILSRTSGP
jgi:hypothetical protein